MLSLCSFNHMCALRFPEVRRMVQNIFMCKLIPNPIIPLAWALIFKTFNTTESVVTLVSILGSTTMSLAPSEIIDAIIDEVYLARLPRVGASLRYISYTAGQQRKRYPTLEDFLYDSSMHTPSRVILDMYSPKHIMRQVY